MTFVCFASQKGSPGVTTTALAVAAAYPTVPGRRKVLVEADLSGGALALRYRLALEPGLLSLAASARTGLEPGSLWAHTQEMPGGLRVVVCPDGPDKVYAGLSAGGESLGAWLASLGDVDVFCDVGRIVPGSPALPLISHAQAVLMLARPSVENLQPSARRMLSMAPTLNNLGWVLVGTAPYSAEEVQQTFGFPVVGVIADDRRSASELEKGAMSKRLTKMPLIRSASSLAETLASWIITPRMTPPDPPMPDAMAQPELYPEPGYQTPPVPTDNVELGSPEYYPPPLETAASPYQPEAPMNNGYVQPGEGEQSYYGGYEDDLDAIADAVNDASRYQAGADDEWADQ